MLGSLQDLGGDGPVVQLNRRDANLRRLRAWVGRVDGGGDAPAGGGRVAGDLLLEVGPAEWAVEDRERLRLLAATTAAAAAGDALAIDEPTAFEVLFASDVRGERSVPGDLASDAATVDRSR